MGLERLGIATRKEDRSGIIDLNCGQQMDLGRGSDEIGEEGDRAFVAWSRRIALQRGAQGMFHVLVLCLKAFESPLEKGSNLISTSNSPPMPRGSSESSHLALDESSKG